MIMMMRRMMCVLAVVLCCACGYTMTAAACTTTSAGQPKAVMAILLDAPIATKDLLVNLTHENATLWRKRKEKRKQVQENEELVVKELEARKEVPTNVIGPSLTAVAPSQPPTGSVVGALHAGTGVSHPPSTVSSLTTSPGQLEVGIPEAASSKSKNENIGPKEVSNMDGNAASKDTSTEVNVTGNTLSASGGTEINREQPGVTENHRTATKTTTTTTSENTANVTDINERNATEQPPTDAGVTTNTTSHESNTAPSAESNNTNTEAPNTNTTTVSPAPNAVISNIASIMQKKANADSSVNPVWMRTAAPLLIVAVLFSFTVY
ncbi:uncharacterized protein TM35_000761130 [Trypanosoma theileri]|uniref:Mucin TcMUCII n=1 Tax=Trypanosoma theileri TaxID=67003 RepID=A0A1X0NGX9_9TRYP|nr:uncharacterized protein TM35_000761130 [Trypanosoma theileri]ORC83168.1 hypothetical protein TM35_000761130 [Trypanosoma theileri]